MKTILRNLFYTLKRFRTASVLNLLGLSTAFAAFILIMMKVSYEYNFGYLLSGFRPYCCTESQCRPSPRMN